MKGLGLLAGVILASGAMAQSMVPMTDSELADVSGGFGLIEIAPIDVSLLSAAGLVTLSDLISLIEVEGFGVFSAINLVGLLGLIDFDILNLF